MSSVRTSIGLLPGFAAATILLSCGGERKGAPPLPAASLSSAQTRAPGAPSPSAQAYAPALGELMTLQQMRHAKLWWAGEARNWELADYELGELKEGFDDIVRYHPTHKDAPVPINEAVPTIMGDPLKKAGEAIASKDRRLFVAAYDTLTEGCNACHQATNFGFNVVKRPTANTFSNQSFTVAGARDK
jgi:hypothetical protein